MVEIKVNNRVERYRLIEYCYLNNITHVCLDITSDHSRIYRVRSESFDFNNVKKYNVINNRYLLNGAGIYDMKHLMRVGSYRNKEDLISFMRRETHMEINIKSANIAIINYENSGNIVTNHDGSIYIWNEKKHWGISINEVYRIELFRSKDIKNLRNLPNENHSKILILK